MSSTGRAGIWLRSLTVPLIIVVVALALFAPGAKWSTKATHGPDVPHVGAVAIDLEPTVPAANTCSSIGAGGVGIDSGDITSTMDNVPLNSPFLVDIVVDSVPSSGVYGIGVDFGFDDDIMQVTAVIANAAVGSVVPAGPLYFCDPTTIPFGPLIDVNDHRPAVLRVDVVDLSGVDEAGPGRVLTLQLECTGTGTSFLTLSDIWTGGDGAGPGGSNTIGILGPKALSTYPVTNEMEAVVGCNTAAETFTPAPTATGAATPTDAATGSPTHSPAASATTTPTAPPLLSIDTVAIDLEPDSPAANTCSSIGGGGAGIDSGDITSTLDNVPLNSPFLVDIVVDSVPPPGVSGILVDFGFDNDIMQVTAVIANTAVPGVIAAGPLYFCAPSVAPVGPLTDYSLGHLRVDVLDSGGVDETGSGRLLTLELECTGTGQSFLTLSDARTVGNIFDPDTMSIFGPRPFHLYPIEDEIEAAVGCNTSLASANFTPTPTPTPSPTPTPTPTATPEPTPSPSPTPSPTPRPSPTAVPGIFPPTGGGSVPVDGSLLWLLLVVGGVALAIGAGLLGFAVRRRTI